MSTFLAGMIRAAGQAPRHLITDRGREFTARTFRRGCRHAGTRQRFGAIGRPGSIALVERCIRTLKEEGVRRWLAPIRWRSVGRELSLVADAGRRLPVRSPGKAILAISSALTPRSPRYRSPRRRFRRSDS